MTLQEIIKEQNDYSGVSAWHAAGYTGQGVTVWNCEKQNDSHGAGTAKRVTDAAPACNLVTGTVSMSVSGGEVQRCEVVDNNGNKHELHDWLTANNVRIITASLQNLFKDRDTAEGDFWQSIIDKYGIILINSAGNDGNKNFDFSRRVAWLIGALYLSNTGKPKRHGYSSTGQGLDFADFTARNGGTSCAAPYFAGKCALVLQRFPGLSPAGVYDFMKHSAEDLEDAGEDIKTGWGLPVLPDLNVLQEENDMAEKKTTFNDVEAGRWSEDAIAYCVQRGYMQGMGGDTFAPAQPLTREQAAQIIHNLKKEEGSE